MDDTISVTGLPNIQPVPRPCCGILPHAKITSPIFLFRIIRRVEEDKAPDKLLAEKRDANGKVIRTRPLFPWPQVAKYNGNGSTDEEKNFTSKEEN